MLAYRYACLPGCSEDPDVKGTETEMCPQTSGRKQGCSEDPDVKGTETKIVFVEPIFVKKCCSEDPDVKGTETISHSYSPSEGKKLQRGSRCKGN